MSYMLKCIYDCSAARSASRRPGGRLVWATSSEDSSRVVAGAMRAAGFVDVKVDVTRLRGAARWTPVVGLKPR